MADRTIVARRVLTPTGWIGPAEVRIDGDGSIASIGPPPDAPIDVHMLVPGFVDLQVNGIDDVDVAIADGDDWDRLDELLLAQGVTTWCPTLVTAPLDRYAAPLARIEVAASRPPGGRPSIAGAHLEGPFLGAASGAHRREHVVDIDLDWIDALPGIVRLVTLGPERPGAPEAIARLVARGVTVSLGHTTATAGEIAAAVGAGASLATHLFNAMSGLHHRDPGVVGAVLSTPALAASLIADGVHVHPTVLGLAARLLNDDRMVLVTDAVAWRAGRVGPVRLAVVDGAPRLPDGTLAGSDLRMDRAIRVMVHEAGVEVATAIRAASTNPARVLGLADRGEIRSGLRADLVALDPDLHVDRVWVGGTPVVANGSPLR